MAHFRLINKFLSRKFNLLLALSMLGMVSLPAVSGFADAPSPTPPVAASVVTNGDGSVTLTVSGTWAWPTHNSDCNNDRYAVGWAVDWNDANQAGNLVGNIGATPISVGSAAANAYNLADNSVHYYSTSPRCGVYGVHGSDSYNTGNWGPMTHTYAPNTTSFDVCNVTYDMHQEGAGNTLKSGDDIAGGAGHNKDNSVEGNDKTPQGNQCIFYSIPKISTSVSAATIKTGNGISDSATLSDASTSPAATGTITFKAYGPNDSTCSNTPAFTSTVGVSGNGTYPSGSIASPSVGIYRWVASYSGDANNAAVSGSCNDANENTTVTQPIGSITIVKDADPTGSQSFSYKTTGNGLSDFSLTDNPPATNSKTFSNLAAGSYTVSEDSLSGWALTGLQCSQGANVNIVGASVSISLADDQQVTCTYTNSELGSISGQKLEVNANGGTVSPAGGWVINLVQNNQIIDSQITGANGAFSFTNLLSGIYSLFETPQNGWTQIYAANAGGAVTLTPGQSSTSNNFGNFKNGSISGYKFNDLNGNGIDNSEPRLGGWTIDLKQANHATVTTTTDVNGNYSFNDLAPGDYTVCEEGQTGWTQITPSANGGCFLITVALSGHDYSGNNFGNQAHGNLVVIKHVINDNSGTKTAQDFTMSVTGNSATVPNFAGQESPGTTVVLNEGGYSVNELDHTGYTETLSPDCSGTVAIGQTKTCTITNNDIPHPGIHIVKSGPTYAHAGDVVAYSFSVTNTGDVALSGVTVADDIAGNAVYQSGDTNNNDQLDLTETWTFKKNYTVPANTNSVVNTGTACGYDPDNAKVCDDDQHTLTVIHPAIRIVKSGPIYGYAGQQIGYTYTVTNTGDTTLSTVHVTDNLIANVGTCSDTTLVPTQTTTCSALYVIPNPTSAPITNIGTAHGTDALNEEVTSNDDHTVIVIHPQINVVKSGATYAHLGDTVTYTFTVTNPGDIGLSDVTVQDNVAGGANYVSGDANNNDILDTSETWIFTKDYTVPTGYQSDSLTNTATACGYDPIQANANNAQATCNTDEHTLTIIHPSIQIVKDGPIYGYEGQTIGYTYIVTNTGDTTLYTVNVTDNLIPTVNTCDNTTLIPNQTTECTASYLIPTPTTSPITNTGTAHGTDTLQEEVTANDNHTVIVIHPHIHIVKSGPANAHPGDTVTYTFTVTNTGDVPLSGVTVVDNIAGDGVYQSGDVNNNNMLDLYETWIFTKNYVVPQNQTTDVLNTATACGYDVPQTNNDFVELLLARTLTCSSSNHNLKVIAPPQLANTGQPLLLFALIPVAMLTATGASYRGSKRNTANRQKLIP